RRSDFALQGEQRDDAARLAASAAAFADRSVALAPQGRVGLHPRARAWLAQGRAAMLKEPDAALAHFARAQAYFAATPPAAAPPRELRQIEFYRAEIFIRRRDADRAPAYARA